MSVSNAFPLSTAEAAAAELQQMFGPYCRRIAVAGSVRRRALVCHDVELVVVPKIETQLVQTGLFDSEETPVDRLADFCELISRGDHHRLVRPVARPGCRAPAWGDRLKKLLFNHLNRWRSVDLCITSPERFGSILAIRTGDAEFSHLLVTKRHEGGAMPEGLRQANGQLERLGGEVNGRPVWVPVSTPEEEDFFNELGLPKLTPNLRTEKNLRELLLRGRLPR